MFGSFRKGRKRGMSLLEKEERERKARWSDSPLPVLSGTTDSRDKKAEDVLKKTLTKMRSECPHCFEENIHGIEQDKKGNIPVQCTSCKELYEVKHNG